MPGIRDKNYFLTNLQYVIYATPVTSDGTELPMEQCTRVHCRIPNNREYPSIQTDNTSEIYPTRFPSGVFGSLVHEGTFKGIPASVIPTWNISTDFFDDGIRGNLYGYLSPEDSSENSAGTQLGLIDFPSSQGYTLYKIMTAYSRTGNFQSNQLILVTQSSTPITDLSVAINGISYTLGTDSVSANSDGPGYRHYFSFGAASIFTEINKTYRIQLI